MSEQEADTIESGADVAGEPGVVEITARSPKSDREVTFRRNFGANLDESTKLFGANVVHSVFVAQATIRAQSRARLILDSENGSTAAAIAAGETYTPGVVRRGEGRTRANPFDVLAKKIASGELTQEQLLAELQARLAAR